MRANSLTVSMRDPQAVDFQAMIDEIHRYFVHVLQDKLGGIDDGQSQMAHGSGHVVIRFNLDGETLVFRVPKFGLGQMRSTMLAYLHLGHLGVMPEKVYHDPKCIIERFVPGVPLGVNVSAAVIADLARKLAAIHAMPASGYGPLAFDRQGSFEDAKADYLREGFADNPGLGDLPAAQQAQLRDAMHRAAKVPVGLMQAPMVLGHGDLWSKNILASTEDFKVIDWDRVGAYPRERELALLVETDFSGEQQETFLSAYGVPVRRDWVNWFALRKVLANPSLSGAAKLAAIDSAHWL